jgi:hypothetical protein
MGIPVSLTREVVAFAVNSIKTGMRLWPRGTEKYKNKRGKSKYMNIFRPKIAQIKVKIMLIMPSCMATLTSISALISHRHDNSNATIRAIGSGAGLSLYRLSFFPHISQRVIGNIRKP